MSRALTVLCNLLFARPCYASTRRTIEMFRIEGAASNYFRSSVLYSMYAFLLLYSTSSRTRPMP